MPRIPVRIQTAQPVGTSNPAVVSARSTAPPNIRALGPFQPRLQFQDFAQNRAQRAVVQALAKVAARYDADQQVIPAQVFAPEVNTIVPHGLGRAYVGASLINPSGAFVGYWVIPPTDSRLAAFQIVIWCLTGCTADLVIW